MEEAHILGDDLPLPPKGLFDRLSQIPGYTWDLTFDPIHSSYDHWHVVGVRHSAESELSTLAATPSARSRDSGSAHNSPRNEARSYFRHHWRGSESSSDVSSPRNEGELAWMPVVARVSSHVVRLEREFHMIRSIIQTSDPECKHTVRPIDIIRLAPQPGDRAPLLVTLYDFPGPNYLRRLVNFGPAFFQANERSGIEDACLEEQVPLTTFLDFAIGACECLELLHYGLRTVHGEIRADAFHFNQETGAVKIANTGNGARAFDNALSEGWSTLSRELGAKNKLQFIAPEQTGRTPTEPDSRTDIYALGVLFWSMLAGRPAFDGDDPVEVVQNVLSKKLPPVCSYRMDIPVAASGVIEKMTQQLISQRYHTISSVKWDLQQIARLLGDGDGESLQNFEIAQRDVSSFFTLPSRMFGRKEERDRILNVIQRVQKRQQATIAQATAKTNIHSLHAISSSSSISDGRVDSFEVGDGSSDSGSFGLTAMRSNSTSGPYLLAHTSTQESNYSIETAVSTHRPSPLSNRVKSPTDSRMSWDNADRDSHISNSVSSHSQFDSLASLGRRKVNAKFRYGGRCEVISISGAAGLGKSDLIHRLQPEVRKHGYVAVARLDRSRRVPFEPFVKILASLLRQIFSERDITSEFHSSIRATLNPIWSTLHQALGLPEQLIFPLTANSQSRTLPKSPAPLQVLKEGAEENFLPRIATFTSLSLGLTSKDFSQGPSSIKNLRFADIFIDVLKIMSLYKLICVCLDDVQYADEEGSGLILEIVRSKIRCVFMITGRLSELASPDLKSLFQAESSNVTKIELQPLSEDEVLDYVAATMHRPPNQSLIPLAAVVQEKSQGIPFYVRMILETCYRKNCIWYSWRDSTWQFDLDRIFTEFVSPNYGQGLGMDFIAKRFQEVPSEARSILLWASLLGSPFSFSLVQHLLSGEFLYGNGDEEDVTCPRRTRLTQSKADIVVGLQYLLQSYILLPGETDDEFRFAHDRYAQALASMKQCHNQEKMHFIVAQTMMKHPPSDDNGLYSHARHICLAAGLIKKRVVRRITYRDVLYHAAFTASQSGAKPTALWFYQNCLYLLQDNAWDVNELDVFYEETRELHIQTADLLLFQGQTSEALELLSVIFTNAHTAACKARAWMLKSRIHAHDGDVPGALQCLFSSMEELGVRGQVPTSWQECDAAYMKLSSYLRTADLDTLFSRPLSQDRTLIAIGAVMAEAMSLCLWGEPLTFMRLGVEMMDIYISHGAFSQIAFLCTHLANIAMSRFKDMELGIRLSDAAVHFFDIYDEPWIPTRAVAIHNYFVNHMRVHIATTLPVLENSMEVAYLIGERYTILVNVSAMVFARFSLGHDMTELEALCNYAPEAVSNWSSDLRGGVYIVAIRQVARALQGKTFLRSAEHVVSDEQHDNQKYMAYVASHVSNPHILDVYSAITMVPLYLYGYHEKVVEVGNKMTEALGGLWSIRPATLAYFYLSLSILTLHLDNPNREGLESSLEQVKKYKSEIDFKRSACDANYGMWSLLLEAMLCEATGNYQGTMQAFEAALDHTQLHNWPLEEALGLELQVDFLVRRGAKRAARCILHQAIAAWNSISASGKARQLSEKHEWLMRMGTVSRVNDVGCQTVDSLLNVPRNPEHESTNMHIQLEEERKREWLEQSEDTAGERSLDISGMGLDIIDLSSILEFSQVMSSELQIDKLLTKMVGIILESCSGSELALVVTEFGARGWCVAAAGDHEHGEMAFPDGLPFSEAEDKMALQITHYTLRTRERVLVHNVLEDERFSNVSEGYAARYPQGRSVIALPIVQASNLLGVIHIEGKPNSFTQRNLVVLRLVCNQVGISLANANLFQEAHRISASNAAMVEAQKRALAHAREAEQKAKVAEAEAKHNVKLKEDAAKAKSIFLANVSHDLRTPMNGVIGLSELLKGTNLDPEQDGYVESIRVCADTLLTLINDILDFSKLEAGKMKVATLPLNLRETIAEVVRALRYTHRDRGLETIEDLDDVDPNLLVLGDPVRLHQIFMNLLSNSYKFTPKGSVTVRAKVAREDKGRVRVTCTVADTGIGITGEQMVRLFRPFSQADNSTARSYGGSGLGLSICKAIIEDVLGGKISLESQQGVGTTVTFTLVFNKAPKDAVVKMPWSQEVSRDKQQILHKQTMPDLSVIPRDQIRVCIAEDNPINQKIAVTFVKNLGLTSEAYSDGQQAVEALKLRSQEGRPFHLVLMDVQMPVLDGYNATRKIREDPDPNVNEVLVIAMTASAIQGDREKCLEAGMNNYLAKPVRSDVLRAMLDHYLAPMPLDATLPWRVLRRKAMNSHLVRDESQQLSARGSSPELPSSSRSEDLNGSPQPNGDSKTSGAQHRKVNGSAVNAAALEPNVGGDTLTSESSDKRISVINHGIAAGL